MPGSKSDLTAPPPDEHDAAEDAIDLGRYAAADDGESSAVSFSGRSGVRGGSSVITWDELVRQQSAGDELPEVDDAGRQKEIDSDKDLLRQVLADEPPPSGLIYKDPSGHEIAIPPGLANPPQATARAGQGPDSAFILPPDLLATRPDAVPPKSRSSDSLGRTDEVDAPAVVRLHDEARRAEDDDPSAVDIGSRPVVDLPFPLAVDSSVGASHVREARTAGRPAEAGHSDSGIMDLLTSSEEFELDLRPPGPSTADELRARGDLPTTTPFASFGSSRGLAWLGGGVVGLLIGVAASVILVVSGVLSTDRRAPTPQVPAGGDEAHAALAERDAALADASAATEQAQKAQADLEALTARLKLANLDVADLPAIAQRLAQARAAEDETKRVRAQLDALTAKLRVAEARPSAEEAIKLHEGQLARAREQLTQKTAAAQAAEDRLNGQLAQMAATRQALAATVQEVTRRLSVAPNAPSAEVLAALDSALARPSPGKVESNPALAEQQYAKGRRAYRSGDHAAAEQSFAAAEQADGRDARYPYFLGLARLALGRSAEAVEDFLRGAALEGQNLPNPAEIDRCLESLPREARWALDQFRR